MLDLFIVVIVVGGARIELDEHSLCDSLGLFLTI